MNEALQNIKEAIEAYIENLRKHDEPVLPSIHEDRAFDGGVGRPDF